MLSIKQNRITAFKEKEEFEVAISTDFSEETMPESGEKGVVFKARIIEKSLTVETRFTVHRIPQIPKGFGSGWEFSAHIFTLLKENANRTVFN